ncbi:MAG: hypothetical protein AB7O24_07575 [Kofleriaceae bacterium]
MISNTIVDARVIAAAIAAVAATAHAGPLADAIGRHADEDVAALRGQLPGDPATRCTLGAVYAKRGDLTRAMIYLDGCLDAGLPDDIRLEVARIARDVKHRTDEFAKLSITTFPSGLVIELDSVPGERLAAPADVWVKPGTHTIRTVDSSPSITKTVTVTARLNATIVIEAPVAPPPSTKPGSLTFDDEAPTGGYTGPPPPVKRESLLVGSKYDRKRTAPLAGQLDDPFPIRTSHHRTSAVALGARVGAGVFDDPAHAMRIRPSVAATLRVALAQRMFVAARADWTRRGGMDDTAIDTLGVSGGVGAVVASGASLALALIAQLRGDVRLVSSRDAMTIPRLGAAAAGTLELSFPASPVTAGLRFEQGMTELIGGGRDRALLIELGVDLR